MGFVAKWSWQGGTHQCIRISHIFAPCIVVGGRLGLGLVGGLTGEIEKDPG